MNLKKGICFLLAGALGTGTILGGCSRKDTTEDAVSSKGGYIEEEMEAPWQEGEYYMGSFLTRREIWKSTQKVIPTAEHHRFSPIPIPEEETGISRRNPGRKTFWVQTKLPII